MHYRAHKRKRKRALLLALVRFSALAQVQYTKHTHVRLQLAHTCSALVVWLEVGQAPAAELEVGSR